MVFLRSVDLRDVHGALFCLQKIIHRLSEVGGNIETWGAISERVRVREGEGWIGTLGQELFSEVKHKLKSKLILTIIGRPATRFG